MLPATLVPASCCMGATGKGHRDQDRALCSWGRLRQTECSHCQRHKGEESPQILFHVAMISARKLSPSIINHSSAPGHLPHPRAGAGLPGSVRGWSEGPCPAWDCTPRATPEVAGHLAASRHPWLAPPGPPQRCGTPGDISASLASGWVEAALLALGGLARTDVSQGYPCLLPGVAFRGSHVPIPLDPTPPPPRTPAAQTSLCSLFSSAHSTPGRAAPAGASSRKPEEQDKSFGIADQGLQAFLALFPGPLSKGPHRPPAPGQAPARAGWYFYFEWHRTCCCSGGALGDKKHKQ